MAGGGSSPGSQVNPLEPLILKRLQQKRKNIIYKLGGIEGEGMCFSKVIKTVNKFSQEDYIKCVGLMSRDDK